MSEIKRPLLQDPNVSPTPQVLQGVLGSTYSIYEELTKYATSTLGLTIEWNYYKDGKSWLGKVVNKKKTVFWLSAWDGFFKTTFYFTEKHLEGFAQLAVAESIKQDLCTTKPVGKLLPLLIDIKQQAQLPDVFAIMEFKKSLK